MGIILWLQTEGTVKRVKKNLHVILLNSFCNFLKMVYFFITYSVQKDD